MAASDHGYRLHLSAGALTVERLGLRLRLGVIINKMPVFLAPRAAATQWPAQQTRSPSAGGE